MARFLALVNMVGLLVKNPDFTVIFQALSRKVVSFLLLYFVQRKKEERICKFSTSSFYRAPISFLILDLPRHLQELEIRQNKAIIYTNS